MYFSDSQSLLSFSITPFEVAIRGLCASSPSRRISCLSYILLFFFLGAACDIVRLTNTLSPFDDFENQVFWENLDAFS